MFHICTVQHCHCFFLTALNSAWWKSWSKAYMKIRWKLSSLFVRMFGCLLACSSSGAPWSTGALLSDWQVAGELYDGDISPAVSHFPGTGSPDTQKRGRIQLLTHPFWIMFGVQKSPGNYLLTFIFLECGQKWNDLNAGSNLHSGEAKFESLYSLERM